MFLLFIHLGHIRKIITSLEKIIEFYDASIEHTNLDGLYGLRVVEGKKHKLPAHV